MHSASIANTKVSCKIKMELMDHIAKKFVLKAFSKLQCGHLTIEEGGEVCNFGEPREKAEIVAHIYIHHPSVYRDVFFNSSIGAAEAYMRNSWTTPDLLKVMRVMILNLTLINKMDNGRPLLSRVTSKLAHVFNANTRKGSHKNIAAHYDLSNGFFSLFLDSRMMYSSAVFPHAKATLEEASFFKLDTICKKLELKPQDHLLEIGSGWGGLAIHAATHYECRVTTTTISKQQHAFASKKIKALGLEDKITLLRHDYRDLRGQYDKLVSVEMIEAVGHRYYDSYFSKCSSLLKADGLMLIQAITIADQRYRQARASVDFIQRYIFPGGCLPSNEVIARYVCQKTDMQIVAIEDITPHYAKTLSLWRRAFHQQIDQVRAMGFDEVFCRMWDFYFCYCEGGFHERAISTGHFLLAKPGYRFDRGVHRQ